jgi:hypothetical protein
MRRPPPGFRLAALYAAAFGAAMLWAAPGAGTPGNWVAPAERVDFALLAVLAAVAAEALWFGHRWAYPATRALAAAFTVSAVVMPCAVEGPEGLFVSMFLLFLGVAMGLPVVIYVREQSAAMFGIPRPRPAPPQTVMPPASARPSRQPAPWW